MRSQWSGSPRGSGSDNRELRFATKRGVSPSEIRYVLQAQI